MCQGPVPARLKTTQYPDIKNHEATSISLPSIRLALQSYQAWSTKKTIKHSFFVLYQDRLFYYAYSQTILNQTFI
jgi:hypothetical protein